MHLKKLLYAVEYEGYRLNQKIHIYPAGITILPQGVPSATM